MKLWGDMEKKAKLTPRVKAVVKELDAVITASFGGQGGQRVQTEESEALARWRRGMFGGVGHDRP